MDTNNPASAVKPVHRTFKGPWDGDSKIVVGIDIGTTYSGIAFTFLVPAGEQMIHRVTQWPGQQSSHGKVPSLIWYDSDCKPKLFGAEAQTPEADLDAEDNGWELAQYFKLHLHPPHLINKHGLSLDPLPFGVSLRQVYSDFLRYLLQHTQKAFEKRISDGSRIWCTHRPNMEVVIGHPNGYGIREQSFLRSAAVAAGFATSDKADTNIRFVTEAEASVHFCLHYTDLKNRLEPGMKFVVCDAGGSTVDTTLYSVQSMSSPLKLGEERDSACIQAGAIFVDKMAESFLHELFNTTDLPPNEINEYTVAGARDFEAQAKRTFSDPTKDSLIKIAGTGLTKPALRIRRGKLTLTGTTIQLFFRSCVNQILESVEAQLSGNDVPYVLLVGGFGESPYLCEQLQARFGPRGTQVTTTDEAASKAVADGALIWHCVNSVIKRAPHISFGIEIIVPFNQTNNEHAGRAMVNQPSGPHVRGAWSQIVPKGVPVSSDAVSREPYTREYWTSAPHLHDISEPIYGFAHAGVPKWLKDSSGQERPGFKKVCLVKGDLSGMSGGLQSRTSLSGSIYWVVEYNVCIRFGRTELEAYYEWVENGVTRTGPAKIVPITDLAPNL